MPLDYESMVIYPSPGFSSFVLVAQAFQPALRHSLERLCYWKPLGQKIHGRLIFGPAVRWLVVQGSFNMAKENKPESQEEIKRVRLNFFLLIIGVIIAGISFAWHIIPLFFKG